MKRIPYGQSNFEKVATQNFYYVDKTRSIETLENLSVQFLVFLRPRRFGKSLFVSMLQHYYDCNRKDDFERLFGNTYIGSHPTPLRNHYPVLFFTFSGIRTYGTIEDTIESFNLSVNGKIRTFLYLNKAYLEMTDSEVENILAIQDGGNQLRELIEILNLKEKAFYLMIDEYDNFGNNILAEYGKEKYLEVTHGVGFLRNFFAVIKDGTRDGKIDRLFVTGVSPLVLADVTSGFNIGTNISLFPALSSMVGFTQQEMEAIVDYYIIEGGLKAEDRHACIEIMKEWYNGYRLSVEASEPVYNSEEEGVKMFLLAYLNMAEMYRVESEKAFEQGYSDIFLYPDVELFPDIRYGYIFELKYLKSRDINTDKKKREQINKAFRKAKQQLQEYTDTSVFKRTVKKVVVILSAHEILKMEEIASV